MAEKTGRNGDDERRSNFGLKFECTHPGVIC